MNVEDVKKLTVEVGRSLFRAAAAKPLNRAALQSYIFSFVFVRRSAYM